LPALANDSWTRSTPRAGAYKRKDDIYRMAQPTRPSRTTAGRNGTPVRRSPSLGCGRKSVPPTCADAVIAPRVTSRSRGPIHTCPLTLAGRRRGGLRGVHAAVSVAAVIDFAYRSPSGHVAVETAAALISLLAAQLMYGRFQRSWTARISCDRWARAVRGIEPPSRLFPAILDLGPGSFATWAPPRRCAGGGLVRDRRALAAPSGATSGVAARRAGALCSWRSPSSARSPQRPATGCPRRSSLAVTRGGSRLRVVGEPGPGPPARARRRVRDGSARAFRRTAERTGDRLMLWFGIGATLASFARLNYSCFRRCTPTTCTRRRAAGRISPRCSRGERRDPHRPGRARAGGGRRRAAPDGTRPARHGAQTSCTSPSRPTRWRAARRAARRRGDRLRRPSRARRLPRRDRRARAADRRAAGRALAAWPPTLPADGCTTVEASTSEGLELSVPAREAVLRIVGEAVTNAARHGRARLVRVELADRPRLCLSISDDGSASIPRRRTATGATGSRHARARGARRGRLDLESRPGEGTRVVVTLP
jgi:hypothetical protein